MFSQKVTAESEEGLPVNVSVSGYQSVNLVVSAAEKNMGGGIIFRLTVLPRRG